jgi:hypothetical protein
MPAHLAPPHKISEAKPLSDEEACRQAELRQAALTIQNMVGKITPLLVCLQAIKSATAQPIDSTTQASSLDFYLDDTSRVQSDHVSRPTTLLITLGANGLLNGSFGGGLSIRHKGTADTRGAFFGHWTARLVTDTYPYADIVAAKPCLLIDFDPVTSRFAVTGFTQLHQEFGLYRATADTHRNTLTAAELASYVSDWLQRMAPDQQAILKPHLEALQQAYSPLAAPVNESSPFYRRVRRIGVDIRNRMASVLKATIG